nr:hypothetical protein [Tanacetum cinerariifolium]
MLLGAAPPKTKASVRKTKSSSDTTITPPTTAGIRLSTSAKGKQPTKSSKANGLTMLSEVAMTEAEQMKLATKRSLKERQGVEDDDEELNRDVNICLEGKDVQMTDVHTTQEFKDTHVTLTLVNPDGQQQIAPLTMTAPTPPPPPTIPTISQVPQAPTPPSIFLQDLLNFGSLFGFDHRLKTLEANFSEFVQTNQFAGAISSIPGIVKRFMDQRMNEAVKIEKTVNEQLEAEVLTRSSNLSKTSYVVAGNLSEMELKKVLIEKWKATDTYGDTVTLKRHRDDANKDVEPFDGSDWGSKRRRDEKEPESTSAPKEKATKTTGKSTQGSKSHQKTTSESAPVEETMQTTQDLEEPSHQEFETDTLTHELLAGPTYELMKGSCKSLMELEFFLKEVYKETTNQLDWNNPKGQQYPHNMLKPLLLIPNSRGRRFIPFDHFFNNDLQYLHGGASSRKYSTSVTMTMAADYGHIKDDDKLYKFKEGDFKRLRIQDIKDIVLLLVQGNLTNLTVEERFAFNVSLKRFTRSIVIQRRVEDLQLGVKSYQKKLNLTKPDTYRFDLKRKEAYTTYSNPRGFIYQNKEKQSRLMRIDELHKFSDGTLNDVRTALDDHLKG